MGEQQNLCSLCKYLCILFTLVCCCFILGAAVDYSDGFVGCIRALQVNGVIMDLRGKVERGEVTYGVAAGRWRYYSVFLLEELLEQCSL